MHQKLKESKLKSLVVEWISTSLDLPYSEIRNNKYGRERYDVNLVNSIETLEEINRAKARQ